MAAIGELLESDLARGDDIGGLYVSPRDRDGCGGEVKEVRGGICVAIILTDMYNNTRSEVAIVIFCKYEIRSGIIVKRSVLQDVLQSS